MRAGQLRCRGSIQEPNEAPEGTMGEATPAWRDFLATWWAAVEPVSGTERFIARELIANATHTIRGRYVDGVTPKMRFLWNGRIFKFQSVINTKERCAELVITAIEEVPARA